MSVISQIAWSTIGLQHYLVLAAVLFVCGLLTILVKRNAIGILIGVELILNAANVNLVAFNRFAHGSAAAAAVGSTGGASGMRLDGQVFAIFVIVLAAAEAAVALAIFLNFYNNFSTIDVERAQDLRG
jgi:NADH-quinone oxidoreductase subunit K